MTGVDARGADAKGVVAPINFIEPMADKPYSYNYEPPPSVPRYNAKGSQIKGYAGRVHNDYTAWSAPQRVRDLMGDEAEELLRHRYAEINVWRPIRGPLLRSPLALCDAQTLSNENLVASELRYPDRTGETYAVTYNPAQRWYYFPKMQADEAVLIRCFDSARLGAAKFSAHGAFEDPNTPPDAPPREVIETRALVFFAD